MYDFTKGARALRITVATLCRFLDKSGSPLPISAHDMKMLDESLRPVIQSSESPIDALLTTKADMVEQCLRQVLGPLHRSDLQASESRQYWMERIVAGALHGDAHQTSQSITQTHTQVRADLMLLLSMFKADPGERS